MDALVGPKTDGKYTLTKSEWDGGKADQAIVNSYERLQGLIKSKIPREKPPGFSQEDFVSGTSRILIATDVISRGIDIENISSVISFNTPFYPENYIHRIGRTGRAGAKGRAILLFNEKELVLKDSIEHLMQYKIPLKKRPSEVKISNQLTTEEKEKPEEPVELPEKKQITQGGASFHEKSAKNSKEKVEKKSYEKKIKERYKKPIRRGDKIQNMKKKKKK